MASYSIFKAKFKKAIADAIYKEVTSRTARYYHWFGKENSWQDFLSPFIPANPTTDAPGAPSDNFRYDLHVRRDILTTKLVKPSDVSYVVRRIDWVSGTVYDDYDDAYDTTTGFGYGPAYSGATRLEDSNFYVLTTQFNVYKCIWNNNNSPSTVMPTGTTPNVFETSDGYKWKFMYNVPVSLQNRFLNSEYMPVSNALKAAFYSAGEISDIAIENGGSGYNPATTTLAISGDGFSESNPVNIENSSLIDNAGSGYTSVPNAAIDPPFETFLDFSSELNVSVGQYIRSFVTTQTDVEERFYLVVSGTRLGTNSPSHGPDSNGFPTTVSNGSSELKFVGRRAVGDITISNGSVTGFNITDVGYGYQQTPNVTIDDPITRTLNYASGSSVGLTDVIFYNGNLYTVSTAGILGSSGPTHTSGTATNGTADLDFAGTLAEITIIANQSNATLEPVITPGIDSVFRVVIDTALNKYSEVPDVTIAIPGGSGIAALADANIDIDTGEITGFVLTNEGSGYNAAPSVVIDPPKKEFNAQTFVANDQITYTGNHFLETGDEVTYSNEGGTDIGGLTNGNTYYVIRVDNETFSLAATEQDAENANAITLTPGSNETHLITLTETATAYSVLGTGGEIVDYVITDAGFGYTNANIEVYDSSQSAEWNENNEGGAILTATFDQGSVDTLQANVELLAVPGAIYTAKIVSGGSGYTAANIEIIGDGEGAKATATIQNGQVTHIEITEPGRGYTWTDIIISGNDGSSGASARAIMTPLGGHGSDAIDELNANAIVFYTSISRDKNQGLEITNDYRKVGLVRNLKRFNSNRRFTEDIGSGCVLITGQFDPAQLEQDMLLTKDEYKKYRIVEFTDTQILLSVFNNFTIGVGDVLTTDPTNDGRVAQPTTTQQNIVVTAVSERTIDQFSGDFLFFSVRESYAPSSDQIITVRTIVEI